MKHQDEVLKDLHKQLHDKEQRFEELTRVLNQLKKENDNLLYAVEVTQRRARSLPDEKHHLDPSSDSEP